MDVASFNFDDSCLTNISDGKGEFCANVTDANAFIGQSSYENVSVKVNYDKKAVTLLTLNFTYDGYQVVATYTFDK